MKGKKSIKERILRRFKRLIKESFDPNAPQVSMFVGRFQPFTLGHLKCVEKLYEEYDRPVLILFVPVSEAKVDKEHPIYGPVQEEMYKRLKDWLTTEYPKMVADVVEVKNSYLQNTIDVAKGLGYQPIGWGCGTDRYLKIIVNKKGEEKPYGYKPMHDSYLEKQRSLSPEEQSVNPDNFNLLHIKRDTAGETKDFVANISGTDVRNCLKNGDRRGFEDRVPNCLWDMFDVMRELVLAVDPISQETNPDDFAGQVQTAKANAMNESKEKFFTQLIKDLDNGLMDIMN